VTKTSSSVYFWSNEPSPRPRCLLPGRARVRTPGEGTGPTLPTLLVWQPRERTVRHRAYSAPPGPRRHPVGRVPRPGVPRIFPTARRVRTPGEGTGPTLPTLLVWQPRERTVRHRAYQTAMPHAVLQRGNQRRGEGMTARQEENCRKLRNANSGKSSSGLWGDTRISPPKPAGPSPHEDESGDGLTIPQRGMKTNRGERPVG
jgi:hypothetical protein